MWRPIGDALYTYGVSDDNVEIAEYIVTPEQYIFLQMLNTKPGWEACRDLS